MAIDDVARGLANEALVLVRQIGEEGTDLTVDAEDVVGFDAAVQDLLTWSNVTGKPATFTPATHSHVTGDVTDLAEFIRDTIATALVAGSNMTITVNDGSDTITLVANAAAGGDMFKADNLSGLANYTTARSNMGLGTLATLNSITASSISDHQNIKGVESMIIAASDETTTITTGTAKVTLRMPYAFTLTDIRASVNTVSSSGVVTVDVNEAGVSILSTKLTIDASEKTSVTAATPVVISDTSLADDAEITIDIDTAGTGAKGLKVVLIGRRT